MKEWTGEAPAQDDESETGDLTLPADLERTVAAFLLGATQWRWKVHGWGAVPSGLDYGALRNGLALARLKLSTEEFDGVRIMERAALPILERRFSA